MTDLKRVKDDLDVMLLYISETGGLRHAADYVDQAKKRIDIHLKEDAEQQEALYRRMKELQIYRNTAEENTSALYAKIAALEVELADLREDNARMTERYNKAVNKQQRFYDELTELREQMEHDHDEDAWRLRYTELREAVNLAFDLLLAHEPDEAYATLRRVIRPSRQLIEEEETNRER